MAFDSLASRMTGPSLDSLAFDFNDPFEMMESLKTPGHAPVYGLSSLHDYLKTSPLCAFLGLEPSGKLSFHWANWAHTCQKQREFHSYQPERLHELESVLQALKRIEIWLKGPRGTIKTCLYDLYENYLDPRLRASLFSKDQKREREILFSDYGESGPFKCLSGMKWFDKNIYALFIFRKLLLGFVPHRQFRLSTELKALWLPNNSPLDKVETTVHQVSSRGVLFRVQCKSDFYRLENHCQNTTAIHFPRALVEPAQDMAQLIEKLTQEEQTTFHLTSQQLEKCRAWNAIREGDGSFFFIDAQTLFGDQSQSFVVAMHRCEEWFKKELK